MKDGKGGKAAGKKQKKDNFDFLTANLDDLESSEDDDYVPDAKTIQNSEKELIKQNGVSKKGLEEDVDKLTGLDLIRHKKRERETDDLWAMMNED